MAWASAKQATCHDGCAFNISAKPCACFHNMHKKTNFLVHVMKTCHQNRQIVCMKPTPIFHEAHP